jgi:iron complex outermembrane receptor protein
LSAQVLKQLSIMIGANNLFDVYPDKFRLHPRNDPNNFSVDPNTSFSSGLDNTNRNRFVYNANQFGFNGGYYFVRLNLTLPTK